MSLGAGGKKELSFGFGQAVEIEHQFVYLGFQSRHVGAGRVSEDSFITRWLLVQMVRRSIQHQQHL